MAKKKKSSRVSTRARAAARKVKGKMNFDFKQVAAANAGGLAAAFIIDKADDNDKIAEKPENAALIAEGAGLALHLFGGQNPFIQHMASGIMGGAAANLYGPIMDKINSDPVNGTNTINAAKERAKRMQKRLVQRMKGGEGRRGVDNRTRNENPAQMGRGTQTKPIQTYVTAQTGMNKGWKRFSSSMNDC